jgi:hypothetical protein
MANAELVEQLDLLRRDLGRLTDRELGVVHRVVPTRPDVADARHQDLGDQRFLLTVRTVDRHGSARSVSATRTAR